MEPNRIIAEVLAQPIDAISYKLSCLLEEQFPDKHLLVTSSGFFQLYHFAFDGHCALKDKLGVPSQWVHEWDPGEQRTRTRIHNAWLEVEWQGERLDVVSVGHTSGYCRTQWHYIIGETREAAHAFFSAVCAWISEVRGEILVYDGSSWAKSEELYNSILTSTLDDLVLEGSMKDEIVQDLQMFFESKERYER
jgi:hypothetical protein